MTFYEKAGSTYEKSWMQVEANVGYNRA